jgi:hypothetical protein
MAAQRTGERSDLADLGTPLSDSRGASEKFRIKAAALMYPTPKGSPEESLKDIRETANQSPDTGVLAAINQAKGALAEIRAKSKELQYQQAFDEVGMFTTNAGYVAARGGNGDLLVAKASDANMQQLQEAGYRDGSQFDVNLYVPFSNNADTTNGVQWTPGTGTEQLL